MTDAATLDTTDAPTTRLRVTGMECASCAAEVEAAMRRLQDGARAQVSVASGTLAVRHGAGTDVEAIAAMVRDLGYGAEDPDAPRDSAPAAAEPSWYWSPKAMLAGACVLALAAAYALGHVVPATERWAFLAAITVGLVPVARRAFAAARNGTPFSIETLMTVSALGPWSSGRQRGRRPW